MKPASKQVVLDLPAGLGGDFKGGLECSPLLRGEDGAWALGALVVFAFLPALSLIHI